MEFSPEKRKLSEREDIKSFIFNVSLPNGVSIIVNLERLKHDVISIEEFKEIVRFEYMRASIAVDSLKKRRKIFWNSPNLCIKSHGCKLFKVLLCLFDPEKLQHLILDDGETSLGLDEEIPRSCPAIKEKDRFGTVIVGLPLSGGRIAFGSDTRLVYGNGTLVLLDSGAEYQSLKLRKVDENSSMAICGDDPYNLKVHQEVAYKTMTEMRTADGLASLVNRTMHRYYDTSINSGIFLGVIEDGKTRIFHHSTDFGPPTFYESRGYLLDGCCLGDAAAYLATFPYDPNMEDVAVLQLLKHLVNLTAGRAISDSVRDARMGNFHVPYVGGWVLGSIIQDGMPYRHYNLGQCVPIRHVA